MSFQAANFYARIWDDFQKTLKRPLRVEHTKNPDLIWNPEFKEEKHAHAINATK